MTVTLDIRPEIEGGLQARAQANGKTVEEYLISVVESAAQPVTGSKPRSGEERAAAFEKWSASHRPTALLSDYAISREAMYEDHKR